MPGILIIAEHLNGSIARISKEIVGAASCLKEGFEGRLFVVVLSNGDARLSDEMNLEGVDEVINVNVGSDHFDSSIYEDVIIEISHKLQPSLILFGHTANGMACAAAIAARLGTGYASDIIDMQFVDGQLTATRSAHAGKIQQELVFPNKNVVTLTIRGATFKAPEVEGDASLTQQDYEGMDLGGGIEHIEYIAPSTAGVDISKADVILSIGRGIHSPDNIPRFAAIAEKLDVTLGCSRPFADAGILPKAHQVGQSGTVASACKLYIAIGISGAVQHMYGMKHVDSIVAINIDPNAPIFDAAKYGSLADSLEVANALEALLESS